MNRYNLFRYPLVDIPAQCGLIFPSQLYCVHVLPKNKCVLKEQIILGNIPHLTNSIKALCIPERGMNFRSDNNMAQENPPSPYLWLSVYPKKVFHARRVNKTILLNIACVVLGDSGILQSCSHHDLQECPLKLVVLLQKVGKLEMAPS